jgi:hypothetical protein
MTAGPGGINIFRSLLIYQQPVRFNMAFTKILKFTGQGMVFEFHRQRFFFNQEFSLKKTPLDQKFSIYYLMNGHMNVRLKNDKMVKLLIK